MKCKKLYVLLLFFILVSCSGEKNELIGSWEESRIQMDRVIFKENGTVKFESDYFESDSIFTYEYKIISNKSDYIEFEILSFKNSKFIKKNLHKATFHNVDRLTIENVDFPDVKPVTYQRITEQYSIDKDNKKTEKKSIRSNNLEDIADSLQFADELCFIEKNYKQAHEYYRGIINSDYQYNQDSCAFNHSAAYLGLLEVELSYKPADTARVFNLIDSAEFFCPSSGEPYLMRASSLLLFDLEGAEENLTLAYENFGGVTFSLNSCITFFRDNINFNKIKFDWENVEFENW